MSWPEFWASLLPPFLALLSVAVTALIGVAATALKNRANITIEQAHREALHSAIMTGVQATLRRLGPAEPPKALITETIEYAHRSVPDALTALRPSSTVLADLAEAKLNEALTKQAPCP